MERLSLEELPKKINITPTIALLCCRLDNSLGDRGIDPGFKIQLIYIVTHIHTRDVMRQGRIHNDDDNGKDQSRRNHGRGVPAVAEQWDS